MGATAAEAGRYLLECRLEGAHDLAALLAALQLREKDQKDQRVHCEASSRGLKFMAQSSARDVAVLGWMFGNAFKEFHYQGPDEELHLRLPLAPLLSCLQIFSDRAQLLLRYPGPAGELHFTLEEDGAVTECRLRTLALEGPPAPMGAFFAPGDPLSVFRPSQPEAWHLALSEFAEFDAPDVQLRITLRAASASAGAAVVLRGQASASEAEVELPQQALESLELAPAAARAGEVTHSYPLGGVLAGCLRAARDARAVKVRFSAEGVMSSQFILRGRGQRELFCEALVSPCTEAVQGGDSVGF